MISPGISSDHGQPKDNQNQGTTTMFKQEDDQANGFSRKDYNRRYYQTNKQRINAKKKGTTRSNVLQLFSRSRVFKVSPLNISQKILRWTESLIFLASSIIMTQYLVRESAIFYLEGQEPLLAAYTKAVMVEGTGILFSFSRGKGKLLRWSQKVVMVLLCSLTLFTMSCKVFRTAAHDSNSYRITSQSIKDLETEQEEKGQLRKALINREWIGATRRHDKDLVLVRQRLTEARQKLETMEAPDVTMGNLAILIIFRLLVVATNLICIHRVVELMASETVQKQPLLAQSRVGFTLNST